MISTNPVSISSKFIRAVSWTTLTSFIGRVCGLVSSILIARFLGVSSLGIYTIVLSTLGLFTTFLTSGLGLTGSKLIAQYCINDPKKVNRIIGLLILALSFAIIVGSCIYWTFIPHISSKIYKMPELLPLLKISFLWLIVMSVNHFLESILVGLQEFKSLTITGSIFNIFNLLLILLALFFGGSDILFALIIAGTVAGIVQVLLVYKAVCTESKKYEITLSFYKLKELVRPIFLEFSIPAFIGKMMEQPLSWVSILLLVRLSGNPSLVGGLTIITSIRTWLLYLPNMLTNVLMPLFTDIYHTRHINDFRRTLIINHRFLWFTTFPFIVLILSAIKPTIRIFFGNSYEIFWLSGAIFLTWTILLPINEVNDKAMISMGKMWLSLFFRIIYLVLVIIGLLFFIPKYSLEGYVVGWGIAYLIYVIIQTLWLKHITHEKLSSFLLLSGFSIFFLTIAFLIASFITSFSFIILYSFILFFVVLVIELKWLLTVEEKILLSTQLKKVLNSNK